MTKYCDMYVKLHNHSLGKALLTLNNITPKDLIYLLSICELFDGAAINGNLSEKILSDIANILKIDYDSDVLTKTEYFSIAISNKLKEMSHSELYSNANALLKYFKTV